MSSTARFARMSGSTVDALGGVLDVVPKDLRQVAEDAGARHHVHHDGVVGKVLIKIALRHGGLKGGSRAASRSSKNWAGRPTP